MAVLNVNLSYKIELTVEELKLVHRALHLLSASKDQAAAAASQVLAAKLAKDRKNEFDQRSRELEKLLVNIEKGAPLPKSDANACAVLLEQDATDRDDSSPMDLT